MKNVLLVLLPIMVGCGDTGGSTSGGSAPAKSTKPSASAKASASAAATTSTTPTTSASATAADSASASASGSAVASGSASAAPEDDCTKLCASELKCAPAAAEKEMDKAKMAADKKKAELEKINKELEPTKCHETCTTQSKGHEEAAKKAAQCTEKTDCDAFLKCVADVNKAEAGKKPAK